jgi:redox-sensitive bicupin YhaK (pirin superfamily)
MSAGSGLRHEEHNIGDEEVKFLQIWIEPKLQNITPRYQKRYFPREKRRNKLQTIISNAEGMEHCWINQNAQLTLGWFDQGQQVEYKFQPVNKCVYIFILEGNLLIDSERLGARDAIGLWETERFTINVEQKSEFIIIEVPINS